MVLFCHFSLYTSVNVAGEAETPCHVDVSQTQGPTIMPGAFLAVSSQKCSGLSLFFNVKDAILLLFLLFYCYYELKKKLSIF